FLPITLATQAGSWSASRLMPRLPARAVMVPGSLVAAAGMALLTQVQVRSGYLGLVLPAEMLLGLGTACVMVPAVSTGTPGLARGGGGAAAPPVNTAQQIGGSRGTALLTTTAASAPAGYAARHSMSPDPVHALVHGYRIATTWGTAILVLGGVV